MYRISLTSHDYYHQSTANYSTDTNYYYCQFNYRLLLSTSLRTLEVVLDLSQKNDVTIVSYSFKREILLLLNFVFFNKIFTAEARF